MKCVMKVKDKNLYLATMKPIRHFVVDIRQAMIFKTKWEYNKYLKLQQKYRNKEFECVEVK